MASPNSAPAGSSVGAIFVSPRSAPSASARQVAGHIREIARACRRLPLNGLEGRAARRARRRFFRPTEARPGRRYCGFPFHAFFCAVFAFVVKAELVGSGLPRTGFMRRTRSDFGSSFAWARRRRAVHALISLSSLALDPDWQGGGALSGRPLDNFGQRIACWRQPRRALSSENQPRFARQSQILPPTPAPGRFSPYEAAGKGSSAPQPAFTRRASP